MIKSIQRGQSVLSGTSLNITISSVNMNKTILICIPRVSNGGGSVLTATGVQAAGYFGATGALSLSTRITFSRSSDWGSQAIAWQVIELE